MPHSRTQLDDRLVAALQEDPRATVLSLAEITGFPRAIVATRLKELQDSGDLRIVAAVHPDVNGDQVRCHVSIAVEDTVSPVAQRLGEIEEAVFVATVTGRYELVAEVRTQTQETMRELLERIRSLPGVLHITPAFHTGIVKGYLAHVPYRPAPIDEIDRELIAALGHDGRMSWQDLAAIVNLSPSAVRTRVRRIFDSGAACVVVMQRGGRIRNVISVSVGLTLTAATRDALERTMDEPEVEFAIPTLGRFDALLVLRARSNESLHELLERVRLYPEVIDMETWAHLHAWKESFARLL